MDYDAERGTLTWKVNLGSRAKAREEAGTVWIHRRQSYRRVQLDGTIYLAHRLCFLIYYGAWPSGEIDHLDQNGLNNRISNLRAATKTINMHNQRRRLGNRSGVTGVRWRPDCHKWRAFISVAGRHIHLGHFDTLAEAAYVRKTAERRYGYHENHGRGGGRQATRRRPA